MTPTLRRTVLLGTALLGLILLSGCEYSRDDAYGTVGGRGGDIMVPAGVSPANSSIAGYGSNPTPMRPRRATADDAAPAAAPPPTPN